MLAIKMDGCAPLLNVKSYDSSAFWLVQLKSYTGCNCFSCWLESDVSGSCGGFRFSGSRLSGYWLLGARTQSTALDTLSCAKLNFKSTNTNTNTNWKREHNLLPQAH